MYYFVVEVAGFCVLVSYSDLTAAEEAFAVINALESDEIFTRGCINLR